MKLKEIDWVNSWKGGNKSDAIFDITIRLGRLTILELYCNPGQDYRIMILNFGAQWDDLPF